MAKKSLSEQLSELTKPVKEFDIEDLEFRKESKGQSEEDSDSDSSENEELRNEHYVQVRRSRLRQNADQIDLGDDYQGEVASRKDIYDTGDEDGNSLVNELSEDDSELSTGDISNQDRNDNASDGIEGDTGEEEVDSEDLESNGSTEEDSEESENESEDETLEHKRNKMKEIMKNERQHVVNRLSLAVSNDALKGYAVKQQLNFFDNIVDSRMKVQKAISNANLLPRDSGSIEDLGLGSDKTLNYIAKALGACFDLLDTIFELRRKVLKNDNIVNEDELSDIKRPKKRSLKTYSTYTEELDRKVNTFRSSVLNKWSAKIQNSSGASALSSNKFRAINQSAEQQVLNNLANMDRLHKRVKINRRRVEPLDYESLKHEILDRRSHEGPQDAASESDEDVPNTVANEVNDPLAELDQIFDDEDFYRVLLRDLVDKKIHSSNPANGLTITLKNAQKAQKLKKNVDTKASKGRKLKYDVQDPIANFEVPKKQWKWDDDQIDEFFASLLGQKINMNEIEDDHTEEADDSEQEVARDTIRIFG